MSTLSSFTFVISISLILQLLGVSLGAHVRGKLPIVKIYEIRTTSASKLEAGETEHFIEKPPNSNIVVGQDIQQNSKLVMECDATYPVQWVYNGDGMPEYSTNTSQLEHPNGITRPSAAFIASISLGFRRTISSSDSGKYTCRSLQYPELSVFYYLYASADDKLFTNVGGDTVYYSRADRTVRIPCSVSNPNAVVSLQKSVNGLVQCPLNESITYDSSRGFDLKISNYFDPSGTYLCTAGYNNTYQVVRYTLVKDNVVDEPEKIQQNNRNGCNRNTDCHSTQACLPSTEGSRCSSPCGSVCGRNTQCDVVNHFPRCHCLPNYSGDPYQACYKHADSGVATDICNPSPCGHNTLCERHGTAARCVCAPGFQGDPYVRCYQRDACSPNPCGQNSMCTHRNGFTSCTCRAGYYGQPPHCRAECEVSSHCPTDRTCLYGRCRNPCEGACNFHGHECRVLNRKAVCAAVTCPPGYFGRDCRSAYPKEETLAKQSAPALPPVKLSMPEVESETASVCMPFPCGVNAECVIKTVDNTVLNITNDVALCQCPPGKTGNADMECYPIDEQLSRNSEILHDNENDTKPKKAEGNSTTCTPECGANANCGEKNVCTCQEQYQGNPYIKCFPIFCTTEEDCDSPNASCVSGKCFEEGSTTDLNSKSCGINAITAVTDGNSTCMCPEGYQGIPSIECHKINIVGSNESSLAEINETSGTSKINTEICKQCGKNTVCVESEGNKTICECIAPFKGDPAIGCELNCTVNADCPDHQLCHDKSQRCIDPCETEQQPFFAQCGRDAKCKVEKHVPYCFCPPESPHGSPHIHCKEEAWMPNHRVANFTCQDEKSLKCGPNTACKRFHDSNDYCVCLPGFFGEADSEKGCKLGLQCRRNVQCRADEECLNGKCLDACRHRNLCGQFAGCKAQDHKANCICHIGTILNPQGECEAAKGALAERLLFFRSFEDV